MEVSRQTRVHVSIEIPGEISCLLLYLPFDSVTGFQLTCRSAVCQTRGSLFLPTTDDEQAGGITCTCRPRGMMTPLSST